MPFAVSPYKPETIELWDSETAEPMTCGTCAYYRRRENRDGYGYCMFKFPPQAALRTSKDPETETNTVTDQYGCDLYRSSGQQYAKVQRWRAP